MEQKSTMGSDTQQQSSPQDKVSSTSQTTEKARPGSAIASLLKEAQELHRLAAQEAQRRKK